MPRPRRVTELDLESVTTRPLTPGDWPAVATLFGEHGACGGCWCMWWRMPRHGQAWQDAKGEPNRRALEELVRGGRQHAILALLGDAPAGWCSFGPRESFPYLTRSRALARQAPEGTWSVVCFFVAARYRGQGLGTLLLDAAAARALALGATEVEGFPVVPHADRIPAAFAYTGLPAQFTAAGFKPTRRAGDARPIYVRRPDAR
ncbi:MAG TPA: GNAT family N-acetyltransferase [Polyangia bacterium]|jgi:GNAT superfamily N-acetyltransferase